MTNALTQPAPTPQAQGNSILPQKIACPLCEYDLRGQVEPRCPECGHEFAWDDLRELERNKHPYLFELHPRRNVASFFQTFFAGFRPKKFFTTLKALHPIRPVRLMLYWVITSCLLVVTLGAPFAYHVAQMRADVIRNQQLWLKSLQAKPNSQIAGQIVSKYGSLSNYAAQQPKVTWMDAARWTYSLNRNQSIFIAPLLAMSLWPWLTLLILLISRVSLRQAKIRKMHVVRCVIYSCDGAPILIGLLALMLPRQDFTNASRLPNWVSVFAGELLFLATVSVLAMYATYRLWMAYRHYLRFRHPFWTVASSQIILVLFAMILIMHKLGL